MLILVALVTRYCNRAFHILTVCALQFVMLGTSHVRFMQMQRTVQFHFSYLSKVNQLINRIAANVHQANQTFLNAKHTVSAIFKKKKKK